MFRRLLGGSLRGDDRPIEPRANPLTPIKFPARNRLYAHVEKNYLKWVKNFTE
jgi:hypothetical protein